MMGSYSLMEILRMVAVIAMIASISTALLFAGFNPTRVNRWARAYLHLAWAIAMARIFVASFGGIIDKWGVIVWLNVCAASIIFLCATFWTVEHDHWQRRKRVR